MQTILLEWNPTARSSTLLYWQIELLFSKFLLLQINSFFYWNRQVQVSLYIIEARESFLKLKLLTNNGVFFSTKKCALYFKKNAILCLFFKNVSPSICFLLNNLHFPMVDGIVFYASYKSRVKQMTFVYLWGYQMKFKRSRLVSLCNLEFNFFIVLWSNLKETLRY